MIHLLLCQSIPNPLFSIIICNILYNDNGGVLIWQHFRFYNLNVH